MTTWTDTVAATPFPVITLSKPRSSEAVLYAHAVFHETRPKAVSAGTDILAYHDNIPVCKIRMTLQSYDGDPRGYTLDISRQLPVRKSGLVIVSAAAADVTNFPAVIETHDEVDSVRRSFAHIGEAYKNLAFPLLHAALDFRKPHFDRLFAVWLSHRGQMQRLHNEDLVDLYAS